MAFSEQRIQKQVTVISDEGVILVQWADQVLKDGEVISEKLYRDSFTAGRKTEFLTAVDGAAHYAAALGWV